MKRIEIKNVIITVLMVIIVGMSIGYSLLTTQLLIKGNVQIATKWILGISSIEKVDTKGEAYEKSPPNHTLNTATFDVGLKTPSDSITYNIKIKNTGTINAKLNKITVSTDYDSSPAIDYKIEGVEENVTELPSGGENNIMVTVKWNESYDNNFEEALSKTVTIAFDYIQS